MATGRYMNTQACIQKILFVIMKPTTAAYSHVPHLHIMCLSEMTVSRLTWQTRLAGPIISLICTAGERKHTKAEEKRGR